MSFERILRSVLDESGGLAIALMGSDGIAVEQLHSASGREVLGDDVGTVGAEFGRILDEVRKASDTLGGGAVQEVVVSLARFDLVVRSVDDELFVTLVMSPDGNLGKARYLMRRNLPALREQL